MGETRKIKHKVFPYTDEEGLERLAYRGQEVELRDADVERGEKFDAFYTDSDEKPGAPEDFNAATATLDETVAWIEEEKPTVQEVVDAADDDINTAKKLLDAENAVTGNEPRVGVQEGLTAVIQRANE